jgi:hypothetical protein
MRVFIVGLAVAFFAMGATAATAQQSFTLGVLGGASLNRLSGDGITEQDSRTGFIAGGFAKYSFSPMVSLILEAQYSVKGTKGATNSSGDMADLKFDYLDLPLLLNVGVPAGEMAAFNFYAGLSFNSRLKCGYGVNGASLTDCDDPWMEGEGIEWAIPAGLSLDYNFGGGVFTVDLRYLLGLTDVLEGVAAKNNSFQGILKLGFPVM